MKRTLCCLIAFLIFSFSFWCTADTSSTEKVINLGAPICLTGHGSTLGQDVKNGYLLALKDLEGRHPYDFNIIFEDTKSEAKTAVSTVRKLLDVDRVRILLGPLRSSNVMAVAPLTEKEKVILFTPLASTSAITTVGDYVFRNRETGTLHAKKMADHLIRRGLSKVALFKADSANSITYGETFEKRFQNLGGKIIFSTNYNPEAHDFRADILRAVSDQPEALYLSVALDHDAGLLTKQIRELRYRGLITGSVGFLGEKLISIAGKAAEGVLFTAPAYDTKDKRVQEFQRAYQKMFSVPPKFYAANAYDALMLTARAVKVCNGDRTDCIRDFLYGVKDYPGIGGLTTFDQNGDVIKPVQLMTVREGAFQKLDH